MKPFSLDTVLQFRERLESLAQEELAKARREEEKVKEQLASRTLEYENMEAHIARIQSEGVAINELIRCEEHITYIKDALTVLKKELEIKQELVKKAHQELVEKSRDRQVMEKLKEKQNAAWQQYLNKKEAATLDEMAIMFHDRK